MHKSFLALFCQIHGRFMALSLQLQNGQYHIHIGSIMADSWRFHGRFMALSLSLQELSEINKFT